MVLESIVTTVEEAVCTFQTPGPRDPLSPLQLRLPKGVVKLYFSFGSLRMRVNSSLSGLS
jgi:hypothetical protein